jgi:tetratricopeptide (TPR) repeat protein
MSVAERTPAELADEALHAVGSDPRRARRLAHEAVEAARVAGDAAAESRALRAAGLAERSLGKVDEALAALRAGVRRGERGGATLQAAEARMSLAYVLLERGTTAQALAEADKAASALRGVSAAGLLSQRALLLQRSGRTGEALATYRRAIPLLRRSDNRLYEANAFHNRSMLYLYGGQLAAAEADLLRAHELYMALGQEALDAGTQWNLGLVAARRGDVSQALHFYDEAEAAYRRYGLDDIELLLDRIELLLSVGLRSEASQTVDRAIADLEQQRRPMLLAEALLYRAQVALGDRNPAAAREAAARAARLFTRQGRPGWAVVARYTALRADERDERLTRPVRARALRIADELSAIGWRTQELDARIIAARIALHHGDLDTVREEMAQAAAARTSGPVELRIRAWYADALLRLATGRRAAAEAALRAGFRVVERQRATLGATELRVHVAGHAGDLANLGLELALDARSPRKVLDWVERWRARTLALRPARPPDDATLAGALAELRRASAEAESALLDGRPAERILARKAGLEERVRRLARRTAGPLFATPVDPPALAEIAAGLGVRVLVELVGLHDVLYAVTVRDGVAELHELGSTPPARRALDALLFTLRRLALGHGSDRSLSTARASVQPWAARVDAALLEPLRKVIDDRPLVVVPTGSLRSTPWPLLPSCAGRPVTVAPSAAMWLRAASRPQERLDVGRVVLVCGPRLEGAAAEIAELNRAYPSAARLDGPNATVEATLAALDGADVAHVAAHGRLRADNPLFSALELADGPLTAYDLERLPRAPRLVLLPACQSGGGAVLAGDEVMGLTSALFALGTRTAVATVIPVRDEATRPLMVALHDGLRQGRSVAEALAAVQAKPDWEDPATAATAGGFVCYGAG